MTCQMLSCPLIAPDAMLRGPGEQAWHVNKDTGILFTWPRWHSSAKCNSSSPSELRHMILLASTQLCPKVDIIWDISIGRLWTDCACLRSPGNLIICSVGTYCAHIMEQHIIVDRGGWNLKTFWLQCISYHMCDFELFIRFLFCI